MAADHGFYLLPLLFVALFLGLVGLSARRRRAQLGALGDALDPDSARIRGFFGFTLSGRYRQREVSIRYQPGTRSRPERCTFKLACGASLEFEIVPEGLLARIAKAVHLEKDVEIGDPDVDSRYVFRSPEPERLANWFRSSQTARRAVETLLTERNFSDVRAADKSLSALRQVPPCIPAGPDDARAILEAVRALAESAEQA